MSPCGSCKNRCFGGSSTSIIRVTRIGELHSVFRLLVTANVPSSPILVTLMKEAIRSTEILFLQEPHSETFKRTPFFSHRSENLK
jgi:hypothetical protein